MKQILTLTILAALMVGCAQPGSSGGSPEPVTKQLHDVWVAPTEKIAIIGGVVQYTLSDLSVCQGSILDTGDESTGTLVVTNSVYVPGTGTGDPGCASKDEVLTYTKTATVLTLCDSSNVCTVYN